MDEFVTIAVFDMAFEAEIARTRLEVEGIAAMLPDENTLGATGLSVMLGGVRLQVHRADAERALEILRRDRSVPLIEDEGDEYWRKDITLEEGEGQGAVQGKGELRDDEETCPLCRNTDVGMAPLGPGAWIATLVGLGLPLLHYQRRRRCGTCGHRWKD